MIHRVMVVDDSVMMRNIIRGIVTKWAGFQVVATAENGKKALEELNNPH